MRSDSFRQLLTAAGAEIGGISGFSSGTTTGNTAEAPRYSFSIEASLDTIRSRAQGNFDYAGQISTFITQVSTVKRVLETLSTAIPDVKVAIENIQEMIRMETRRAQASTLSAMDNIIAALTGEPIPVMAPATPELVELPTLSSPALVPGSVIEANGLRYEVASADEQRRAEEIAARLLGR